MGRQKKKDAIWLVKRTDTRGMNDGKTTTPSIEHKTVPDTPFRFFGLPYELRLRVYEELLILPKTLDLDPSNAREIAPRLQLLLVNHQMHDEASRVFYSRNTFRVFPIHGRYINKKHPLLAWLPRRYCIHMTRLELRLGPGFTRPPKGWVVDSRLGLSALTKIFKLDIFVEIDPASSEIFEGFRVGGAFYTEYSLNLLRSLLTQLPSVAVVEFDAYPSVSRDSPLLKALVQETRLQQKRIVWSTGRSWDQIVDIDLAKAIEAL